MIPTTTDITRASQAEGELRGWIKPVAISEDEARRELQSLGIEVGKWDSVIEEFKGCVVSQDAWKKLDLYWGRYIWGLST